MHLGDLKPSRLVNGAPNNLLNINWTTLVVQKLPVEGLLASANHARELFAYVPPDKFLHNKGIPFVVGNMPATFQRLINHVQSEMFGCDTYLDDVGVLSSTWQAHLQ